MTICTTAVAESVTIDGVTYQDVAWDRVSATTVTFFHKNGVVTVDIEKLPPELRKRLGYDPKNSAADRAAIESERRGRARQRADDSANEQAEKQEADERAPPSEDYEDKIKIGRWYVDKTIATFIGICGACLVALLLGVWIMLSKK